MFVILSIMIFVIKFDSIDYFTELNGEEFSLENWDSLFDSLGVYCENLIGWNYSLRIRVSVTYTNVTNAEYSLFVLTYLLYQQLGFDPIKFYVDSCLSSNFIAITATPNACYIEKISTRHVNILKLKIGTYTLQ